MIRYALIAVATIAFAACGAEAPPEAAPATPAPEAKKAEAAPVKAEAAPAAAKAHDHDHAKACVCGAGKAGGTVWCDACGAGYIKGEKTKDKAAVTTALASAGGTAKAAAHDHADGKACTCGVGKSGGTVWCSACGSGYVKGEKTKDKAVVTAALAAAKPTPAAK
jgi:hypothetical protein